MNFYCTSKCTIGFSIFSHSRQKNEKRFANNKKGNDNWKIMVETQEKPKHFLFNFLSSASTLFSNSTCNEIVIWKNVRCIKGFIATKIAFKTFFKEMHWVSPFVIEFMKQTREMSQCFTITIRRKYFYGKLNLN